MWVITHVIKPNTMQNLLLLHLRGQHKLTARKIEQATGIPAANYMEYEQGIMLIPDTELDLLCTLFKVKWIHLRTYSDQLDYFSHSKGILDLKDKRINHLTKVLKRYIRKAPQLKPKTLKL
jgi:transcriptional regulator with XRE-family HTH domain